MSVYIIIYLYVYIYFSYSISHIDYYREPLWVEFRVLYRKSLMATYFIYSSVYMLISTS